MSTLKGKRERTGPPTLSYLGNVDGPQCHANQVVPATGLVDDAMTPARTKDIVGQTGKPDLLPCRGDGFPAIRRRLTYRRVSTVCSRVAYSDQERPWRSYLLPAGEGAPQGRMRGAMLAGARKFPASGRSGHLLPAGEGEDVPPRLQLNGKTR